MIRLKELEEFVERNKDVVIVKGSTQPGDIVIASVPTFYSQKEMSLIADGLKSVFHKVGIVVLRDDIKIEIAEVIDDEIV